MGCELYRLGLPNPLVSMPVLDTCTETTAQLASCRAVGRKIQTANLTELHEYLFKNHLPKRTMPRLTWRQQLAVFELLPSGVFGKETLDVAPDYFEKFSKAHPQPIQLIGLNTSIFVKHPGLAEGFGSPA